MTTDSHCERRRSWMEKYPRSEAFTEHIYRYLFVRTANKSKQYTWLANNQSNDKKYNFVRRKKIIYFNMEWIMPFCWNGRNVAFSMRLSAYDFLYALSRTISGLSSSRVPPFSSFPWHMCVSLWTMGQLTQRKFRLLCASPNFFRHERFHGHDNNENKAEGGKETRRKTGGARVLEAYSRTKRRRREEK